MEIIIISLSSLCVGMIAGILLATLGVLMLLDKKGYSKQEKRAFFK